MAMQRKKQKINAKGPFLTNNKSLNELIKQSN